jgi:hypothetical protein
MSGFQFSAPLRVLWAVLRSRLLLIFKSWTGGPLICEWRSEQRWSDRLVVLLPSKQADKNNHVDWSIRGLQEGQFDLIRDDSISLTSNDQSDRCDE